MSSFIDETSYWLLSKAAKLRSYFTVGGFDLQNYKFFGTTGCARGIRFSKKIHSKYFGVYYNIKVFFSQVPQMGFSSRTTFFIKFKHI